VPFDGFLAPASGETGRLEDCTSPWLTNIRAHPPKGDSETYLLRRARQSASCISRSASIPQGRESNFFASSTVFRSNSRDLSNPIKAGYLALFFPCSLPTGFPIVS